MVAPQGGAAVAAHMRRRRRHSQIPAIALYVCAAMDQIMPPLMGDDDEPDDAAAAAADDDDDARTVYCSHAVGMAPLSLEVWARFFATYPEALDLLASIPFPARTDDALDFVD